MTLPAPNLDDRRFQDLVDDAKRLVQQRCPEWTDHNVSDPGVTLIETFAYMTDQLLYRLNRVPDRLYVKFLELVGVRLLPPTPARAPVTFWLSAPADRPLVVPAGSAVATVRTETDEAVVFSTDRELPIVPCTLERVVLAPEGGDPEDRTDALRLGTSFLAFSAQPVPGDSLLLGLSEAVPSCAVRLRVRCHLDGIGVDPTNPPLAWEAWDGAAWHPCDVDSDGTGGLNRDGDVVLHVPAGHAPAVFGDVRAGWLRLRVLAAEEGQPAYRESPVVHAVTAQTVGGTVEAVNAELVEKEPLGVSEGVPGQRFTVRRAPVLAGAGAPVLESTSEDGWQEWTEVADFAASGPADRHFILDSACGEVVFGPAVREPDGGVRQHGAVPEKGAELRMRRYAVGGGRRGNVATGAISVLRSSIPYVSRVTNRVAAQGGVDGEDIDGAKARGPIALRTRSRAVTAEDYEALTREAAPEVARVRCVPAGPGRVGGTGGEGPGDAGGVPAGSVKVLVVPAVASGESRFPFERLIPAEETLAAIAARLDATRLVGTRVIVEPPLYRGVTVVARLRARPRASAQRVEDEALEVLYRHLNPVAGGPDGQGWPFGRPVQAGEIFSVLQKIRGVELVEDVRLFGANPVTGERGTQTQRLDLGPDDLVFSFGHQVRVEEA